MENGMDRMTLFLSFNDMFNLLQVLKIVLVKSQSVWLANASSVFKYITRHVETFLQNNMV